MPVRAAPANPRVLVIDDDPLIGRTIARLLRPHAEVIAESSPYAALERARRGERFALVVCDIMMPGMTGLQLFERVVACAPHFASVFVFASGGMTGEMREQMRAIGRPCLEKPVSMQTLLALLAQAEEPSSKP